jgi:hypothetical protein
MVRTQAALAVVVMALAGCGGASHGGHASGAHAAPSVGPQHGISKEGLAAIEVASAVAESAVARAIVKDCYSLCVSPAVCDHRTGECKLESKPSASFAPIVDTGARAKPADEPEPTCGGLCWPGERCVVVNGRQDCVPLDKLPPR